MFLLRNDLNDEVSCGTIFYLWRYKIFTSKIKYKYIVLCHLTTSVQNHLTYLFSYRTSTNYFFFILQYYHTIKLLRKTICYTVWVWLVQPLIAYKTMFPFLTSSESPKVFTEVQIIRNGWQVYCLSRSSSLSLSLFLRWIITYKSLYFANL
jgi:hypothetical protein